MFGHLAVSKPWPAARLGIFLGGCLLLVGSFHGHAWGQVVRDHVWVTDDNVLASAVSNNIVYLGGSFTKVGPATGSMVSLDIGTGAALQPYPQVLGSVSAVAPDASGGVYLGGVFTHVAGQARAGLAHLDANGNLTAWNPGLNAGGQVRAIVVSATTVYVGGTFSNVGGQPRANLAALDPATGLATGWAPNPNGTIEALAMNSTNLYVGGFFSNIASQSRANVAAFNLGTGALTGFATTMNGGVYCMVATSSTVWIGGNFNVVQFNSHVGVAALDATTGGATTWNPNLSTGNVYAMAAALLPSSTLLFLGGDFQMIAGQTRRYLASVDGGTGGLSSFNPNPDGTVQSLSVSVGPISVSAVHVGGYFSSIAGQTRPGVAALDASGAATSWDARASASVEAIARSGSKLFVGGNFPSIGWVNRNGIAAFDATTGLVTDWNPNTVGTPGNRGNVFALLVSGYTVYAGGYYAAIGGQARHSLAALDVSTGAALPWNPDPGVDGTVLSLALAGGVMYVGGSFNTMGGLSRENVAAVDPSSGVVSAFHSVVTGGGVQVVRVVTSISALDPPKVFLGGYFTAVGGVTRNGLAQVNGTTGGLASWYPNPNPGSSVTSMIVLASIQGNVSRMYVGGYFTSIGGQLRNRIAELDGAGVATAWNPDANFPVHSLSLQGGLVYVGGSFWTIGGQPRKGLASIDVTTGLPTSWVPNTNGNSNSQRGGTVYGIQQIGSSIWAYGDFDGMLNLPHAQIAVVSADGAVTGVEPATTIAPAVTRFHASPNPFRTAATLRFTLDARADTRVSIYDSAGRLVRRLHDGVLPAGERSMIWDGRGDTGLPVASAIYFLRVDSAERTQTSKVFRLK